MVSSIAILTFTTPHIPALMMPIFALRQAARLLFLGAMCAPLSTYAQTAAQPPADRPQEVLPLLVLNAIYDNQFAIIGADNPDSLGLHTVGNNAWDKFIKAIASTGIRLTQSHEHFASKVTEIGYLLPSETGVLATRHGYAEANAILDEANAALETMMKEVHQAFNAREEAVNAMPVVTDETIRKSFEFRFGNMRSAEHDLDIGYRQLFGAERELVTFVQQQQGKVRWSGNSIQAEEPAVASRAKELLGQVRAASGALQRAIRAFIFNS